MSPFFSSLSIIPNSSSCFLIAIGTSIKIYPIVAASLFLLYPQKIKFIVGLAGSFILLFCLPVLFTSFSQLLLQYHNWFNILVQDQHDNTGVSIIGLLSNFYISDLLKVIVQVVGIVLFLLQFRRVGLYGNDMYRLMMLASLLIWLTLFNHAAESASYVLAITGVALWYVLQKKSLMLSYLIGLTLIVVSVLTIDPSPRLIVDAMERYSLKALPCLVIWIIMFWQLSVSFKPHQTK